MVHAIAWQGAVSRGDARCPEGEPVRREVPLRRWQAARIRKRLLATILALSPALAGAATDALTDARGFIDAWALRKEVVSLSAVPTGQQECSRGEGDGDEEALATLKTKKARLAYERKRRREEALARQEEARCERRNLLERRTFERLHAAFNARWRPVLVAATRSGDPVAEVVLRLCETTPLLDRSGIASDCSKDDADTALARQRLEAIGFKPALHRYTPTDAADDHRRKLVACGQGEAAVRAECNHRSDISRYARILSVMRTGYMATAEGWSSCQMAGETPELDKLVEECQRLMNLMFALSAGARRFYSASGMRGEHVAGLEQLSLQRPVLGGASGTHWKEWPYDKRGAVTRNDFRAFSDADFQGKFYDELDAALRHVEAGIAEDLRNEPRWAVFLVERRAGKLYDAMDAANPAAPPVDRQ